MKNQQVISFNRQFSICSTVIIGKLNFIYVRREEFNHCSDLSTLQFMVRQIFCERNYVQ